MKTHQFSSIGIAALLLIYSGIADAGSIQWSSPASQVSTQQHRAVTPAVKRNQPRVRVRTPFRHSTNSQNSRNQTVVSNKKPAAPKKKGRYRITLNGFHIFAVKGVLPRRGHTYYAAAKVMRYTQWGAIRSHRLIMTKLMGHTRKFPGAIKGGTATRHGGFRNGDVYPGSPPYIAHSAYSDRFPLLVWEGELQEGGDVTVIEPTLWEKRNSGSIFRAWHEYVPRKINKVGDCYGYDMKKNIPFGLANIPPWSKSFPSPIDDVLHSHHNIRSILLERSRACVGITPIDLFRPQGRNKLDTLAGLTEKTVILSHTEKSSGILLNYKLAEFMSNESETTNIPFVRYQFDSAFQRKNERLQSSLPTGGLNVFTYPSIDLARYSFIVNDSSVFLIPNTTVIEMYLQVHKLPN